ISARSRATLFCICWLGLRSTVYSGEGGDDGRRRGGRMIFDPDESAVTDEARTPRQDRRAQTRAALLDAAERLWAERGIRGASLDEIAARAGLTKGAVYSNFASKSDLVLALLERYTQADPGLGALADLCGS